MFLGAQAQTFLNTADVVTAVENFPDHRGTVIGIMKVHSPSFSFWIIALLFVSWWSVAPRIK
jgi:hypothetical protein